MCSREYNIWIGLLKVSPDFGFDPAWVMQYDGISVNTANVKGDILVNPDCRSFSPIANCFKVRGHQPWAHLCFGRFLFARFGYAIPFSGMILFQQDRM